MSTKTTTYSLIETDTKTGVYDMDYTVAIVDSIKHGRLYMAQFFGGMDTMAGGAYRWRHGRIARVADDATLASLHDPDATGMTEAARVLEMEPLTDWDLQGLARQLDI